MEGTTSTGVMRAPRLWRTTSRMRRLMRPRSTVLPDPAHGEADAGAGGSVGVARDLLRTQGEEVAHLLGELLVAGLVDALVVGTPAGEALHLDPPRLKETRQKEPVA
jgi:hypothetical protein